MKVGDVVVYVPAHADKNLLHKDSEYGIVTAVNDQYVHVRYLKTNGIPKNYQSGKALFKDLQNTGKATSPTNLTCVNGIINSRAVEEALELL